MPEVVGPPNIWALFPNGALQLYGRYLRGTKFLASFMEVDRQMVKRKYSEFAHSNPYAGGFHPLRKTDHYKAAILYVICRIIKPKLVVETGVASGTSTVGILSALEANHEGALHSIDLPAGRYTTDSGVLWEDISSPKGPGWLVPERLKPRWTIHIGPSRALLQKVLSRAESIELFYHDSEHTKENMDYELELAFEHLGADGWILADNSNWSNSFQALCQRHSLDSIQLFPFLGVARKPSRKTSSWP